MFLSLFIFRGHSTREPASDRETYFILRAYTGTGVSHSQHRKNRERFWINAGEWTGKVEISKEEIPGSKRSMYGCYTGYMIYMGSNLPNIYAFIVNAIKKRKKKRKQFTWTGPTIMALCKCNLFNIRDLV